MDNIIQNQITVTRIVVGQQPPGTAAFSYPDGRTGYGFSADCAEYDQVPGGQPTLVHTRPTAHFVVLLDPGADRGTSYVQILAVYDRDDGFVRCVVAEDPASSSAMTPPTVTVDRQGASRTGGPPTGSILAQPNGVAVVVELPYTRRDAVVNATFTDTYPVPRAPVFTG